MIPGPPISELVKPTVVGARVDVKLGRQTVALDVPVERVVLSGTSKRSVPHQLTFEACPEWMPVHPTDPLNNFGQRVHLTSLIEVLGTPHAIPLGVYRIEEWEETDDGNVAVTCLDLMRVIADNEFSWPTSPAKGSTFRMELQAQCGSTVPVRLVGMDDFTVPRTFQFGSDPLENIADLCAAYGCSYRVGIDGYLQVRKVGVRRGNPVATYTATDLLRDAPRKSKPRRANIFTVVGQGKIQAGTKTDVLVDQDYTSHSRSGWSAPTVKATFTYPGDRLRATWTRADFASLSYPGLILTKALPKVGTVTATIKVRTGASSGSLYYEFMQGDDAVGTPQSTPAAGSSMKTLTMTLADGKAAEGIRLYTLESPVDTGYWIEVESVTITKTAKGKTTTLLSQDFSSRKRPGWKAIDMTPSWSYAEDGYSGDHLRLTWGSLSGSSSGHTRAVWKRDAKKKVAEDATYTGVKTVSLRVRSSTTTDIAVTVFDEQQLPIDTVRVSAKTAWSGLITLTVPDLTVLGGVAIEQSGEFTRGHWIGIDSFKITHVYPTYKDKKFSSTVSAIEAPYTPAVYGRKVHREELSTEVSAAQVQAAAVAATQEALVVIGMRSLQIVYDPRLELGDVIGAVTESGETLVGRVIAYSKPVDDPDALMRVDVEVIQT